MKSALIVTTYNRRNYLRDCLNSLSQLSEFPQVIIFSDDCSDDPNIKDMRYCFISPNEQFYLSTERNMGIRKNLLLAYDFAFNYDCDFVINLDGDAIVKPNFITRLIGLKNRFPHSIVSGFNCNNPKNPILKDGDDYVLRRHCNGINMGIDKEQYKYIIKPALEQDGNWDYNSTHEQPFVISKPSVVQHIGMISSMGHNDSPDVACDF